MMTAVESVPFWYESPSMFQKYMYQLEREENIST